MPRTISSGSQRTWFRLLPTRHGRRTRRSCSLTMVQRPGLTNSATPTPADARSCWRQRYAAKHPPEACARPAGGNSLASTGAGLSAAGALCAAAVGQCRKAIALPENRQRPAFGPDTGARNRRADRRVAGGQHGELVEQYLAEVTRRADAGEIDVAAADGYQSALCQNLRVVR